MDTTKNILNSSLINLQTTQLDDTNCLNTPRSTIMENDVFLSFQQKRSALIEALDSKKMGNLKEYYQRINKQSFVNAKEEPQALRIWLKVFLDTISMLMHDYKDFELLDLLVFKLPWFIPTTTHGQNFQCFMRLALAIFPHDVSYIHKVIKHIFSPHGLFQCIMLGEHRPSLSDILWASAQKSLLQEQSSFKQALTEEQCETLKDSIETIKTQEDIFARARNILKKHSDQQSIRKVTDLSDQFFLKTLFSLHPTKQLPADSNYPILVGQQYNQFTFMVQTNPLSEGALPDYDDAISIKKCINGLIRLQSNNIKEFAELKFKSTPISKLGLFLTKTMSLYPFAQEQIVQSLLEKLPHKNMIVENQYIYNKLALQVAKACPETEDKILESIIERLCQIDVDIRVKHRHFDFSKLSKIQSFASYSKELLVKPQDDRETKMDILLCQLLDYIHERLSSGKTQEDFIDSLMKIFESKIFPIHKMNFMQLIPLYVMSIAQVNNHGKLFTEKFLSFLIVKSFNCLQKEHLSVRMQAWNYLSSLISRQNNMFTSSVLMKCLNLILRFYDQSKEKMQITQSVDTTSVDSMSDGSKVEKISGQDRIFEHCFVQGLALILVTKIDILKQEDTILFTQICKIIFKRSKQSLHYISPLILADLLRLTKSNKYGLGLFKDSVQQIFNSQGDEMKSSKRSVYQKVSKFLPFETPIYLYSLSEKFQGILVHQDVNDKESLSQSEQLSSVQASSEEDNHQESEQMYPSGLEEEKVALNNQSKQESGSILFIPDSTDTSNEQEQQNVDLGQALKFSRRNDQIFGKQSMQQPDQEMKREDQKNQRDQRKLTARNLRLSMEDSSRPLDYLEDCEVISSSRETEYSISPHPHQQHTQCQTGYTTQKTAGSMSSPYSPGEFMTSKFAPLQEPESMKSRLRQNLRKQQRNLTMTLKEANDKADEKASIRRQPQRFPKQRGIKE